MSTETTIVQELQALADTAAFGARMGVDLTETYNEFAIGGAKNQLLDATAWGRAGVDGTQNIEIAQRNGTHEDNDHKKQERRAREFRAAEATVQFLDKMIADINWQIGQIDERIEAIDARSEAITTERSAITREFGAPEEILAAREEIIEGIEDQQTIVDQALIDCDETALAHQRALEEQARARTPDAMAAAAERVALTHEEAEAARDIYLNETATIEGFERSLAELDFAIERLGELSAEELALMEERGDLVMDRQQLVVLRERLQDPELRAAVERGDMTHQELLDMMPEELQPGIMDSLTTRFQEGWDYGLNVVSNAYDSAVNGLSSMTESLTSTISGVFARATGSTPPETPDEPVMVAQASPALTPAPILQPAQA